MIPKRMFAIATNVCPADDWRIKHTVASWLRTWGRDDVTEILIVVDREPPTGRIAELHGGNGSNARLDEALADLQETDSRIRVIELPPKDKLSRTLARWFGRDRPMRCQAGTPVAAFVYAIDQVQSNRLMRSDCDMVFYDDGFLMQANRVLDQGIDLVEPPRLTADAPSKPQAVSTRALILDRKNLTKSLPIKAHRLDWPRRIHRYLRGRSTYLAFEQMLDREVREGLLTYKPLETEYGYSLHIPRRCDFLTRDIDAVIKRAEAGDVPESQMQVGWNFSPSAWDCCPDRVLKT